MAKNGKKSFLDFFKVDESSDEYEDDLFEDDEYDDDDEDDFEEDYVPKTKAAAQPAKKQKFTKAARTSAPTSSGNSKLVSFNNRSQGGSQQVFVIKPDEFDDAQMIIDHLKGGQAIVINMEGMELSTAQRIIDFIAGACYSLDGSLQAISGNIFIAAPADIYVSGDLREELLNDAFLSPELGKY